MTDEPKEKLKKKIADLEDQLAKNKAAGKDLKLDPTCRQLRKTLKRTQRRLSFLTPLNLEQRGIRVGKLTDLINKRYEELTQGSKKVQGNPYAHSMRKKLKSLNKKKKKLDRIAKKLAEKAATGAHAAPAPAPAAPAAPEQK
jgi:hypothetical protein